MSVVWERSGESFYADAELASGAKIYVIVERLPDGGWDWAVWRSGDGWTVSHHGVADTAREGMRAAERAMIG